MQLTVRGLLLLAATALFLAAGAFTGWLAWLGLAWLIASAALLLTDWQLSPRPQDWSVERSHDERFSLAAWNRIELRVQLDGAGRELPVWLRDETPPLFRIAEEQRVLRGTVEPGEGAGWVYYLHPPRRGDYRFGDLHLRWESVLGLLRRQTTIAAGADVKVYPNLADVKKYDLLLRKNRLWEMGLRTVRVRGRGTEFTRLREYQPDDEYRYINWKATAKRGSPISTEFETERAQNLVALLDVGRMMRSPVGDVAKMDYAINAVLLLAYVAVQKGDRMGVLTFADDVQSWLQPRTDKAQFYRMLELLYNVQGQPVEPDFTGAFGYFAAHQRRHSLALVFSDLTGSVSNEALVAGLLRLRRQHLPLLVTMRDPTVEAFARQRVADVTGLYRRTVSETLLQERALALESLRSRGVLTLDVPADELSVALIERYLQIKARTLL
jgi:uncharacterized protein (DUF58 family)